VASESPNTVDSNKVRVIAVAKLTYSEVSAITYVDEDVGVLLTPEQQSLAIQAMALFAMPSMWSDWNVNSDAIDLLVSETLYALESPVTIPPNTTQEVLTLFHINNKALLGEAISLNIIDTQIMCHYASQTNPTDTNIFLSPEFWLAGGHTYTMDVWCRRGSTSGILNVELRRSADDTLIEDVSGDLYNSTAVANYKLTMTFNLTDDTKVYIQGVTTGKNASSSGYAIPVTCFMVRS